MTNKQKMSEEAFETYLLALRETSTDEHTEHTGRAALQRLLEAARDAFGHAGTVVQHEPKRHEDKGSPDFKISRAGAILGYVENKAIDTPLGPVLKSDQIKKYRQLSDNLLVTDYLHFVWLNKDGRQEARLGDSSLLEGKPHPVRPERIVEVAALLQGFFSQPELGIAQAKPLAEALATRAHLLRDFLTEELVRQEKTHREGKLHGLYEVFKDQVSHEITLGEFADAYAQTLAYGLFLARLNSKQQQEITLDNAKHHIPASIGVIQELVGFLDELAKPEYRDIRWVVEEVLSIINGLKLAAIHEDLAFRNRGAKRGTRVGSEDEWRLFSRDPFVYFYEDFLEKYDKSTRESRGVYYTPPPVVNFIVRAIDDILKDQFGLKQGLADRERVTVLDFACGTGTFIVEVLERIFENIGGEKSAKADGYVREHMLRNIFGFEYLIAPYTIAHLKLGQYLEDKGHPLASNERLQVYLTNTLEPIEPQPNYLLPALTRESETAQEIKKREILVILGNPPYSGHSMNPSSRLVPAADIVKLGKAVKYKSVKKGGVKYYEVPTAIGEAIEAYKKVEEEDFTGSRALVSLGERNSKWLHDDYVKFLRFAQAKMDAVAEGIVGVITNHAFLDNVTFRGMRYSLLSTFDQIHVFDLHGSIKPRETAPGGVANDNVFDIQKGVSITLFIKKDGLPKGVWRTDIWGTRQKKYEWAASAKFALGDELFCDQPMWPFYPVNRELYQEYYGHTGIREIFGTMVLGYQTHRDNFAIDFDEQVIRDRLGDLKSELSDNVIRKRYNIRNADGWNLKSARDQLRGRERDDNLVVKTSYRPFDDRWCIFGTEVMDRPRRELIDHVAGRENIQLLVPRQARREWRHVFVAADVAESCAISDQTKEQNYNIPLYLFASNALSDQQSNLFDKFAGKEKIENIVPRFRNWLDQRYGYSYTPEQIFGYVYAVLHSPVYRARYEDFLRRDFPRIPVTKAADEFEALSGLGWELIETHLMRRVPTRGLGSSMEQGSNSVEEVRWSEAERKLWINSKQGFPNVPKRVWEFVVGGHQVLDKYLKARKGRTISLDEIEHVEKVANVLDFTIDQIAKIDAEYVRAFGRQAINS